MHKSSLWKWTRIPSVCHCYHKVQMKTKTNTQQQVSKKTPIWKRWSSKSRTMRKTQSKWKLYKKKPRHGQKARETIPLGEVQPGNQLFHYALPPFLRLTRTVLKSLTHWFQLSLLQSQVIFLPITTQKQRRSRREMGKTKSQVLKTLNKKGMYSGSLQSIFSRQSVSSRTSIP